MVLHPVGPEPATAYWLRRAVVLLGAVAVLWICWTVASWLLGDDEDRLESRSDVSGSPSPSAGDGDSGNRSPAATASADPSAPAGEAGAGCPDGSLAVAVAADARRYSAGGAATFAMTVRNVGTETCTLDLAPARAC